MIPDPRFKVPVLPAVMGLVAVIVLATHWPVVRGEILQWDDNSYLDAVLAHRPLSLATVRWAFTSTWIYYQPITWLSHGLDIALWGLKPAGHHAMNLALHVVNAGLVVWLASELLAGRALATRLATAGGVGLVFGIHPLQVESVAWLAERNLLLASAFSLGSLLAYVRTRRVLATGLFAAALLCKPTAVTLPLVMLVVDYFPMQRYRQAGWWPLFREKIPLLCLGGAAAGLTVYAAVTHQEGLGTIAEFDLLERAALGVRGYVFYLVKLAWPAWLSPHYPLGVTVELRQPEFVVPLLAFGVLTVACVGARRRAPGLWAAWLAYGAILLPVSQLVTSGTQAVANRYAYLAIVPWLMVAGAGGEWFWRKVGVAGRYALLMGLMVVASWFMIRTRQEIAVWRTDENLWTAVLKYYPFSGVAHGQLALVDIRRQRYADALAHAQAAVEEMPDHPAARSALAQANYGLAIERMKQWRFAEALPFAQTAAEVRPDDALARAALGLIRLKLGQPNEAVADLREALRLEPTLPGAQYNLACAQSRLGKFAEAHATLRRLHSQDAAYVQRGRTDRDLEDLRRQPEYAERLKSLWGQ